MRTWIFILSLGGFNKKIERWRKWDNATKVFFSSSHIWMKTTIKLLVLLYIYRQNSREWLICFRLYIVTKISYFINCLIGADVNIFILNSTKNRPFQQNSLFREILFNLCTKFSRVIDVLQTSGDSQPLLYFLNCLIDADVNIYLACWSSRNSTKNNI